MADEEMKMIVRCVQLYYRHQKQQQEIAQQLGISPTRVSRLLKRAQEEGMVRINVDLPPLPWLAADLIEKYGLRDAVVTPTGEVSDIKEELGIAAARYFERIAGNGVKVGLSCGETLYYLVKNLQEGLIKDLKIYPLATESTLDLVALFPNTLVGMMAARYRPHVSAYALHAQFLGPLEKIRNERKAILEDPAIKKIYEEAHNVDVVLLGVGMIGPKTPGFCTLSEHYGLSLHQLRKLGAVGEINYQPFDSQGRLIETPEIENLSARVICVSVERLREMTQQHGKHVIAVAGDKEKTEAIRAALKRGFFNVLVTDQEVAQKLLEE